MVIDIRESIAQKEKEKEENPNGYHGTVGFGYYNLIYQTAPKKFNRGTLLIVPSPKHEENKIHYEILFDYETGMIKSVTTSDNSNIKLFKHGDKVNKRKLMKG